MYFKLEGTQTPDTPDTPDYSGTNNQEEGVDEPDIRFYWKWIISMFTS
jgi:uncharacterized secreted protein with C-terminal beta-propeller domain